VALDRTVYAWNASNNSASKILDSSNRITALKSNWSGDKVAVSDMFGKLELIDVESKARLSIRSHKDRCCALDFYDNLLATGSRDKGILINDIRTPNKKIHELGMHTDEICGLKWSPNGRYIASGSTNNKLSIWDTRINRVSFKSSAHKSAVKAIAWNQDNSMELATGGGVNDQTIKIWNVAAGAQVNELHCGSQVTNIMYSKSTNELISSHGF
jgi:cell division cycle 20-like protein 1, cofactor of APC complex